MAAEWVYAIISVIIVSLISLIGVITLSVNLKSLKKMLIFIVSFAAGGLFGGAFLHLIPESAASMNTSLYILSGIVVFFVVEKLIHWRHCHTPECKHPKPFAYMNMFGDSVHNFIDGIIIAASYIASIPLGIATTLAVIFHEIPQEIGDFAVLVHGGFKRKRALAFNFISALTAILGAVAALFASLYVSGIEAFFVPFAAGGFIYIAGSDLIPELHKEQKTSRSVGQLIAFIIGIVVMYGLTFVG